MSSRLTYILCKSPSFLWQNLYFTSLIRATRSNNNYKIIFYNDYVKK